MKRGKPRSVRKLRPKLECGGHEHRSATKLRSRKSNYTMAFVSPSRICHGYPAIRWRRIKFRFHWLNWQSFPNIASERPEQNACSASIIDRAVCKVEGQRGSILASQWSLEAFADTVYRILGDIWRYAESAIAIVIIDVRNVVWICTTVPGLERHVRYQSCMETRPQRGMDGAKP
jgi:hypothetical protein